MAGNLKQEVGFVVDKPVPGTTDLRFVRRVADGDRYLAKDYDSHDFPELSTLRGPKADDKIIAFEAAARVLNHENLISVAKPMAAPPRAGPKSKTGSDFSLVYEYCADGNLKQLFDNPPVEPTDQGFLPEGLVWHVALSMLRALTFLHEGRREEISLNKDDDRLLRKWYRPDDDWMPILHCSILPENIHFQAARGKETYGLCKLGDFGRCMVAGTTRIGTEDSHTEVVAVVNDQGGRHVPQEEMLRMWCLAYEHEQEGYPDWTKTQHFGRIYTIGSELSDLGGILYHMMTGQRIEVDLCECGCFHVDVEPPGCRCPCYFEDVDLDRALLDSKYSHGLREVVVHLIRLNRDNSARAQTCFQLAWRLYRQWKQTTEGKAHKDHYDDLVARKEAEMARKLDEMEQGLGVDDKVESLIFWD